MSAEDKKQNPLFIARSNAGLTKTELAKAAGVSINTISKLEKGTGNPRRSTMGKVVRALNEHADESHTIEDLFGGIYNLD